MEEEVRMHRAMERLLAILNLSTVGKAQRRGSSGAIHLRQRDRDQPLRSGVEICPARHVLGGGAPRVRGSVSRPPSPLCEKISQPSVKVWLTT